MKQKCMKPWCAEFRVDGGKYCEKHAGAKASSTHKVSVSNDMFYNQRYWKNISSLYRKQKPLCERCYEAGVYRKSELVHHIRELGTFRQDEMHVANQQGNLEALCKDCHNKEHGHAKNSF